ncbi:YkvI family membrane protein [Brevibacillus reuszeri]|uniref:YkvI family membrane protein n=1 Tax=Brevibacillus reuszeri TaxID=54915 RepID=UPI003D1C1DB9
MKLWGKSIQVAATYVGTVVGAGFASGQEILAFFTSYGHSGTIGILIATVLFVWLGYKMMWLAHTMRTPSYESFNQKLFGPLVGTTMNILVFLTLFGVTTVMLAGAGSVLEEQFQIPYLAGTVATAFFALLILRKGLEQLLVVNAIVVPSMFLFALFILLDGKVDSPLPISAPVSYEFLWKTVLYVSFNLAMAQSVLIPIGYAIREPIILLRASVIGGVILGFMLLVVHTAMLANWNEVRFLDIPILFVTDRWNEWLQLFFVFVLYSEIFTTLISNVFGIGQQLRELVYVPESRIYLFLLLSAFVLCLIGYSQLLMFLYPLFGYLGLSTLCRVVMPSGQLSR